MCRVKIIYMLKSKWETKANSYRNRLKNFHKVGDLINYKSISCILKIKTLLSIIISYKIFLLT